jgi:hypothetical protein
MCVTCLAVDLGPERRAGVAGACPLPRCFAHAAPTQGNCSSEVMKQSGIAEASILHDHSRLEHTLVGVAGEYYVAAELSVRGFTAAITLRDSRGIDIIATLPDSKRSVSIQVKTSSNRGEKWILNKKDEEPRGKDHFFVFVLLQGEGKRPSFHIVPSSIVADYIKTSHRDWLKGKRPDGQPREDTSMRQISTVISSIWSSGICWSSDCSAEI